MEARPAGNSSSPTVRCSRAEAPALPPPHGAGGGTGANSLGLLAPRFSPIVQSAQRNDRQRTVFLADRIGHVESAVVFHRIGVGPLRLLALPHELHRWHTLPDGADQRELVGSGPPDADHE